jgi:hypothetical protein
VVLTTDQKLFKNSTTFAVLKSWMFVLEGFMLLRELGNLSWSPVIYEQNNFYFYFMDIIDGPN